MDIGFSALPDQSSPLFGSSGTKTNSDAANHNFVLDSAGNGHADSMSDTSSSSRSDSEVEDVKNNSSEEDTKQVHSSSDNDKSKADSSDDSDKKESDSGSDGQKDSGSDANSSNEENDDSKNNRKRLSHQRNSSESQDSEDNNTSHGGRKKVSAIREIKDDWDQAPDLYGIRRSGRARREVVKYNIGNSGSDSDKKKRKGRRRGSDDWKSRSDNDDSDKSSGSVDYRPIKSKSKSRPQPRANKRSKKPIQKSRGRSQNLSSESSEEYSDDDNRPVPIRKTAQKVSYKEDTDNATDSDDVVEYVTTAAPDPEEANRETIERVIDVRIGRKGATGHKTTLYNVRENRDPNTIPLAEGETTEQEKQFLIKWKSWSHIHNTWEVEASLRDQKVNGLKKLDNFIKRNDEIRNWKAHASPEDSEYYDCQQEMLQDLTESHKKVERVLAHKKESNGGSDFLCKWNGLPYADCTWEDGDLISKLFQSHIDRFLARNKSQCIPTKLSRVLKARPKFVPLKEQPDYLGGSEEGLKLRDYQLDGLNWMVHSWTKENSVILADEMGLGKTIQIMSFISTLFNQYQLYGPFLLVVPLSTIVAWQRESEKWAPELNVIIYIGDVHSRSVLRDQEWRHPGNKRLKFNVLVTTYEILLKDKTFLSAESWAFLGVDEAHRLKNDDSLLYRSLESFDTNMRILITGTPLQNTLKELWALLHFIMPSKFDNWADFEAQHSHEEGKGFVSLHKQLEPYLLRRVKKDVEKSLPSKTERILRVELSSLQKTYYRAILKKEFRTLLKGMRGSVSSYANIMMELKKCANHAQLCAYSEEEPAYHERLSILLKGSGKLLLLDKLLVRLKETGHRVLIFSQMVRMLDIIAEYLQCRHFSYQRLDGTIRGDLRKQALDHFNAEGSKDFCFLLSTRAGGLGVNLATADTVIIFDSDWNPQNDLQAQARAHRIGQKNQVSVYRLVTCNTVEEKIVESAKKKMVLDHLVIQRMDTTGRTVLDKGSAPSSSATPFSKEELCAILRFGAEELFKEKDNDDEDDQQVDIDDILNRAEEHETEATAGIGNELLSQFKMATFGNLEEDAEAEAEASRASNGEEGRTWEDIIPEDERKKLEEEERQKELLDLELGPRNRKTIKQLQVEYDSDKDKKKKRSKKESDSDATDEDDEDEDEDHPKKSKGRPKGTGKDGIRGFSNAEIRRFVRSYKKFAAPLKRLDAIAEDAELPEKSGAELKRLIEHMKKACEDAMRDHIQKLTENPTPEGAKKSNKGVQFKINSVGINAQAIMKAEEDMKPLADVMPDEKDQRKKWRLDQTVKKVHWDCFWNIDDDSSLLKGVYEYGMGSYEAIKMDQNLGLGDRILPDGELKPQAKHLQTRVDYLLKVLKGKDSSAATSNKIPKPRKKNVKSKAEIVDKDDSSSDEEKKGKKSSDGSTKKKQPLSKKIINENDLSDISSDSDLASDLDDSKSKPKAAKPKAKKPPKETKDTKEKEKPAKAKAKTKKQSGPMHITANSAPKDIAEENEEAEKNMDTKTFAQCKEKMRPMKKILKQLSDPDASLNEKEQVVFIRDILLKIGDHIGTCMEAFSDPEKIKHWREKLWLFVSNFTTLNHSKLRKLYKGACKKRDTDKSKDKKHKDKNRESPKSSALKRPREKRDSGSSNKANQSNRNDHPSQHSSHNKEGNHKSHQRSSSSHDSQPRPGNPQKEALINENNSNGSPGNNWTLASPLSRTDDPNRNRYDSSSHTYNRHPHSHSNTYSSHESRSDRSESKDSYHRYNDRQGPGGQNHHRDYRGRNENRAGYRPDTHRSDHYRPEYGNHYRDQRQDYNRDRGGDRGSERASDRVSDRGSERGGEDWQNNSHHTSSNSYSTVEGARKRKTQEDSHDWDRRHSKDPRMEASKPRHASSQPPPPGAESPSASNH